MRRRLARESGIAMPVVIAIMTIVALLAAGGAVAALGTNEGANEDRRVKRALAAAEAGVQQAAYRLATARPASNLCLSDDNPAGGELPAAGECPAVPGSVASDASFTYHATAALPPGAPCADLPSQPWDPTATEHCITSTGTVAGVKRRLQARVRVTRTTIFGVAGLLGIQSVDLHNSGKAWSDVGSNGLVNGGNSTEIYGSVLIPNGAPSPTINGSPQPPVVRQPGQWTLPQTNFAAIAAGPNNNAALNTWGTSWDSTTRVAAINAKTVTMPAGTYLMCEFYADNSVTINLSGATSTNPVRIYVDSPDRPGSGCAPGTGRFCLDNSIKFNEGGNAGALEVYVYGTSAICQTGRPGMPFQTSAWRTDTPVVLNVSVDFNGTIYAPTSTVRLNNSIKMDGGIAANAIVFENSIEFDNPNTVREKVPAVGPVRRLSWVECLSQPTTAGDPESGCA
jgi:Tfp pilus assembly protein PilX